MTIQRSLAFSALFLAALLLFTACASTPQPAPAPTPTPPPAKAPTVQPTPTSSGAAKPATTATQAPAPQPKATIAAKPATAPLDPPVAVKVGYVPLVSSAGVYIANEKGYFAQEGLKPELVQFATYGQMTQPLIMNELDVGMVSYAHGLFNAMGRAVGVRIVAQHTTHAKGHGMQRVNVRKDLADKIKVVTDLKGKKIAVPSNPGPNNIVLDKAFKGTGMSDKDVELIVLPAPDVITALANKSIDVGMHTDPPAALAVRQGIAVTWKTTDDFYPDMEVTGYVFAEKLMKEKPEAAKRLMVVILRGTREFTDALMGSKTNRKEAIALINKLTGLKDDTLYDDMILPWGNPDGYLNKKLLQDDIRWYLDHGLIQQNIDVEKVVDEQFVDYAVSRLGRFK